MGEIKTSGRPIDQLLEKVLCVNILSSDYFRDLLSLKTYHEVIDEIYVTITHVEPWMSGNCRGPSTAFCLLYKFFAMKLTVKQMHGLLQHPDSPYIRAIGFLYLRYVADPKTLWSWYEPYLKDDEEFAPGSDGRMTTMGVYVRDLLLGQYYFDTLFPRIPVLVLRSVVSNLESMKLPTKHCGVTGETTRRADETARRPPSVKASLSVSFGQRAPHRASTRGSAPVSRTVASSSYDRNDDSRRPSYSERERGRERERERDGDRKSNYDKSRDSYRGDYDRSSRGKHGRREGGSRRSRSRSPSPRWRRSQSINEQSTHDIGRPSPRHETEDKKSASSNLAKLKDLYGALSNQKEGAGDDRNSNRPNGTEEVIRLGGSWR